MNYFTKFVSRIINCKYVLDSLNYSRIEVKVNNFKVERNQSLTLIGIDSKFYPESEVFNLQNNRNNIKIGKNCHIRGELLIYPYGDGIEIGDNTYIGKNSVIRAANKITIGNDVLIAHCVTIIDTDSHEIDYIQRSISFNEMIKKGHPKNRGEIMTAPITIEDNVWINNNVCILKGLVIGKGAIIGAGSIVTTNVAPFTLVAGNPAKFLKELPH